MVCVINFHCITKEANPIYIKDLSETVNPSKLRLFSSILQIGQLQIFHYLSPNFYQKKVCHRYI